MSKCCELRGSGLMLWLFSKDNRRIANYESKIKRFKKQQITKGSVSVEKSSLYSSEEIIAD